MFIYEERVCKSGATDGVFDSYLARLTRVLFGTDLRNQTVASAMPSADQRLAAAMSGDLLAQPGDMGVNGAVVTRAGKGRRDRDQTHLYARHGRRALIVW